MTQSYRATEGEPGPIRQEWAFLNIATHWPAIAAGLSPMIQDYRTVLSRGLLAPQAEIGERAAEADAAFSRKSGGGVTLSGGEP